MPINFIPNDPLASTEMPMTQVQPRPNRVGARARFTFVNSVAQGVHNPGTPGFLFWQCREAALMAVDTWEALNGNLNEWARASPNRRLLVLEQNAGSDLNAYYDGQSLSFFEFTTGTKTTFSGASTDVVAHEAGHAFLDVIRPDLWASNLTEPNAFHEAFGDCIAILTALFDKDTRKTLLAASPDLGTANFVEATAEDLSDGIRLKWGPDFTASAPRRALNDFQWQLPSTLPTEGPPDVLISEVHSFGRIFSGCFYDVIRNIFNAFPTQNEAALLRAAQTAGSLLVEGAKVAPEIPRFFQAVGRAMSLTDVTTNGGANQVAIKDAFARHNISLGSSAMLSPRSALAGSAPKKVAAGAKGAILSSATRLDLRRRIGADPKSRLTVNAVEIAGEHFAEAVHKREVSLTGLSERLAGVVAISAEPILVGGVGAKAAIVSALPEAVATTDEVHSFVQSLLRNGQIDLDRGKSKGAGSKGVVATSSRRRQGSRPTHAIHSRGGKKVLERVRFTCCGR